MANVNRWKYGDTRPVVGRASLGLLQEIGDLVYQEQFAPYTIRPASAVPDQGSTQANQLYFGCRFLGHLSQQFRPNHDPADLAEVRVNTAAVHEYPCAALAADLPIGTPFAPAADVAGTGLQDQVVVALDWGTNDARVIGRLARRAIAADTMVYIELISEVMQGGADADQCSGSSSSGE